MKDEHLSRFSTAPWAGKQENIVIGGAGGIGSWLALALGRCNHNLYVYDMDHYDVNNVGGQFCRTSSVGVAKTEELASNIEAFCGKTINTFGEFNDDSFVAPYTVAAFDNMEARALMFKKWKEQENRELFLDGRMTAEFFEIFAVQKGMEEKYEEYLFPSEEANSLPCSFKATSHNTMGITYALVGALNNYLSDDPSGLREVPFHAKFNIALFDFEIIEDEVGG